MSASLLTTYNTSVSQAIKNYNATVANILKQRMNLRQKQNYLTFLKIQFQKYMANLKKKYDADVLLITKPPITTAITTAVKNKKALLIGINYIGTPSSLNGCINDINSIGDLLTTKYAYNSITKITDETNQKPTRDVILASFAQFLASGVEGDVLFFSYSGHGSYTLDRNNDEKTSTDETTGNKITGTDEMIITSDLKGILDDELKSLIQTHLKKNVTLFALFDCCFSGTVLDLKYQYLDSLENDASTINQNDTETIGNVIMLSGCSDLQTSADAFLEKKYQGAMTWSFISAISESTTLSWKDLLLKMRDRLKQSSFTQLPQLSSGCLMDINKAVSF
jgi:hypothetical protein